MVQSFFAARLTSDHCREDFKSSPLRKIHSKHALGLTSFHHIQLHAYTHISKNASSLGFLITQGEGATFEIFCIFFGGAKAHTVEFERVRLQSVVRSLRTADCKRTTSNSVMCAFAPPEKVSVTLCTLRHAKQGVPFKMLRRGGPPR